MSLLFFDGFDGYDSSQDAVTFGGWTSTSVDGATSSVVRTGSGKSIFFGWDQGTRSLFKNMSVDKYGTTLYLGFALDPVASDTTSIFTLGNNAGTEQCSVKLIISGAGFVLSAYRGATLLATGSIFLTKNVWRYVELKINVHATTGIFDCKIDGISNFTFSGNTANAGAGTASYLMFRSAMSSTSPGQYIDDFYICDSAGSVNNTYLGEVRAEVITPTSDSSIAWTHNTGASNWDAINDTIGAPDDNTTYVSSSTSAAKDEYGLSDLTGVNAVAGVKLITRAEKDDVNALSFKHGIKSGSTDQQVTYALGVGYANFIDIFETSDGSTTAFTATTVNSLLSTLQIP